MGGATGRTVGRGPVALGMEHLGKWLDLHLLPVLHHHWSDVPASLGDLALLFWVIAGVFFSTWL